jgi:hypothetical protein
VSAKDFCLAMRHPTALTAIAFAILSVLNIPTPAAAKSSEWTDIQGEKFKGEPSEALGSLAVFKVGSSGKRLVPLHGLSVETCQRFFREAAARPARADRWSDAKSLVTEDFVKNVFRVEKDQLVPADLDALPEPEILLVLFGSHNNGESWALTRTFVPTFERLQRVYPGRVGTVFMGFGHAVLDHKRIATTNAMPWLVADFQSQPAMHISRYTPAEGATLLAISRHGVPLLSGTANSTAEIRKFADALAELLWRTSPANSAVWPDFIHYANATRPLEFVQSDAPPLLVGSPLQPAGLSQRGVKRVDASFDVNADGSVANVSLLPTSEVPEPLRPPLLQALTKTVFSPAIHHGQPVAGTYAYSLTVPPADARLAADIAWLQSNDSINIAFKSWLVLRPIRVSEEAFNSTLQHVDTDGTNVLQAMQVSGAKVSRKSQMNAFNSDWFTTEGAASVQPKEGDVQPIDGASLVWEKSVPTDGEVNFLSGVSSADYCIGYAWTEFEMPEDIDALLGIGSDDGLKIWHNGRLVNDKWVRRMSRLDEDVVPLRLKKGKNQLLIKIQNVSGGWDFICRLRLRS